MEASPEPSSPASSRFNAIASYLIRFAAPTGLLFSIYLVWQHIEYQRSGALNSPLCSVGGFFDCERVEASGFSSIGGIPIASFGVFYFLLLSALAWLFRPCTSPALQQFWKPVFVWATFPAFVAAWCLAMLSALVIDSFCLGCTAIYLVIIVCTAAPALAVPGTYFGALKSGPFMIIRHIRSAGSQQRKVQSRWIGGAFAVLIAGAINFGVPAFVISQLDPRDPEASGDEVVQKYFDQPVVELLPVPDGMNRGDPESAIRIVVFTDFKCGYCHKFDQALNKLLESRASDTLVSTKHFPLSRECNPVMKQASFDHPQACRLALMAATMGELGFFDPWGSELYQEGSEEIYPALKSIATRADQNMNQWAARSLGEDIRQQVEADIVEGMGLGLRGVPAVYVNGRKLLSTDTDDLARILDAIESGSAESPAGEDRHQKSPAQAKGSGL